MIDTDKFDVQVIAPRPYFIFTPMLAASSVVSQSVCPESTPGQAKAMSAIDPSANMHKINTQSKILRFAPLLREPWNTAQSQRRCGPRTLSLTLCRRAPPALIRRASRSGARACSTPRTLPLPTIISSSAWESNRCGALTHPRPHVISTHVICPLHDPTPRRPDD